jgi:hypothetical protein
MNPFITEQAAAANSRLNLSKARVARIGGSCRRADRCHKVPAIKKDGPESAVKCGWAHRGLPDSRENVGRLAHRTFGGVMYALPDLAERPVGDCH